MCLCSTRYKNPKSKDERGHCTKNQNRKMSDSFCCVWGALLLASLLISGQSSPITEESTINRRHEKQGNNFPTTESEVAGHPVKNVEEDVMTTKVREVVPLTGDEMPDIEGMRKESVKRDADDDDSDSDSDYYEDGIEREGTLLRHFARMNDRTKRDLAPEGTATQPESEFVDHVLDYSLDRMKREEGKETKMEVASSMRKRRQSGETVPYIIPNRSRRDAEEEEERRETEEVEVKEEAEVEETEEKMAMES